MLGYSEQRRGQKNWFYWQNSSCWLVSRWAESHSSRCQSKDLSVWSKSCSYKLVHRKTIFKKSRQVQWWMGLVDQIFSEWWASGLWNSWIIECYVIFTSWGQKDIIIEIGESRYLSRSSYRLVTRLLYDLRQHSSCWITVYWNCRQFDFSLIDLRLRMGDLDSKIRIPCPRHLPRTWLQWYQHCLPRPNQIFLSSWLWWSDDSLLQVSLLYSQTSFQGFFRS